MPYTPKSTTDQFTSDWNKAIAWASSQGIQASSYLPVYAADQQRMANGEYPMSAAERNTEILAAHNPNQVPSSPSDNPRPSNVIGNTVNDVRSIATGIAGIFTGSFEKQVLDSAKNTYEGIVDPGRLEAKTFGGTVSNYLDDTLLSFLPGATDIGTVLKADPNLSGSAGSKALAEHPLVSILDVLPGDAGGILGKVGKLGIAEDLSERVADQGSITSRLGHMVGDRTIGRAGITMSGDLVERLSITDLVEKMAANLGNGKAGVGKALSDMSEQYNVIGSMKGNLLSWMVDPANKAINTLSDEQFAQMMQIIDTNRTTGGDSVSEALASPEVDPKIKDAIRLNFNGPLRFATEERVFSGENRPIYANDGRVGIYSSTADSFKKILKAKAARDDAHARAANGLLELHPAAQQIAALDAMLPKALGQFTTNLTEARKSVAADAGLTHGNITQDLANPGRFHAKRGISKSAQVQAVLGEGGLADEFKRLIEKNAEPDQVRLLAEQMKRRLSKWGPKSIDVGENEALAKLYATVDSFEQWAKHYQKAANKFDEAIYGAAKDAKRSKAEVGQAGGERMQRVKAKQQVARDEMKDARDKADAAGRADLARSIREITARKTWAIQVIHDQTEAAGARATRAEIAKMVRSEKMQINDLNRQAARDIGAARRRTEQARVLRRTAYQRDVLKLQKKHLAEIEDNKKYIADQKAGYGELSRELDSYAKSAHAYQEAIADHPSDEYRDAAVRLYQKHLLEHENVARLIEHTEKGLRESGVSESRIEAIRSDPQILAEFLHLSMEALFKQPTQDPEMADIARQASAEASKAGQEELKTLIAQGFKIHYIPAVTEFDSRLSRDSMAPAIAHGIPKPDMAKARDWSLTPHKDDFALAINKAVIQTLHRDATIEMAEHYLKPLTVTQKELEDFILKVYPVEDRTYEGNVPHELMVRAVKDLGVTEFDPNALFGFKLPRWGPGREKVYLPTPMVNALKKMERMHDKSLLGTTNKIFRYSILGLSPRYTAHILFGGSMMLALRSSPYAVTMIGKAVKALRDGSLPEGLGSHPSEEGYQEAALRMVGEANGKALHRLTIQEHIEVVQKVARAAATPAHVLKAMADINLRFTRYVRDLQGAVAYLDGAAKAERRGAKIAVEDPHTGKMVEVSTDRAMVQGMHHVNEVFGNLNRMSPFERQVAQSIMPFYGWQKHILGYVMSFPFDHPWRALVLSQLAFNASQAVPLGLPTRIQLLFFLGSPDSQGNVNAIDARSLDPFRDVGNYATWTGFFESLNPAIMAPMAAVNPQAVFGSNSLYPNLTYDQFYGTTEAGPQGNLLTAAQQIVPQLGGLGQALSAMSGVRSTWNTNRSAAIKQLLSSMNIPFVTPPVNLKQIAARDAGARFEVAKTVAYNAFQSGDFSSLKGYKTVPNPLNPALEITPAALEQLYLTAQQATPGVAPIESLLPPPTPSGW